ncbi:hypothetical protein ANO11243_008050 [Dothideomycetidae sp. 11243]|nr:hypothetical protein ANO11243_008050 [fungal sp. No.11243]
MQASASHTQCRARELQHRWTHSAVRPHSHQQIISKRALRPQPHGLICNSRALVSRPTSTTASSTFPSQSSTPTTPPPYWAQTYHPPTTGVLSLLPPSIIPYAELSRLDKPIGTYYLFIPCLWSTLLASILTVPITPPSTILATTALFFSGALVMRGAGCTINDIWDRNFDAQVERTRLRPLARGAVSLPSAIIYTGGQCLVGLAILLQFPSSCFYYAAPSLLFVGLYPLAKRITYYPQLMLGLTFSWGAMMGFPALGVDLISHGPALGCAAALYASNVAWTVAYDAVYAHLDLKDDKNAGIKSIARAHEGSTKSILVGLAGLQTALLAAAGWAVGVGPAYYAGVCGASVVGNAVQIWKVRLDDPESCWWWFRYGVWITGGGVAAGMGLEYAMQYLGLYGEDEEDKLITTQE